MTEKVGTKYAQNARFVGRKNVAGPLTDLNLAHIVSELHGELRKQTSVEELRCNLEFSDRHLLITYIKKDEGFESDGESTKSNEAVKIVFNDDTSSANSSASDSDDLTKSTSTSASASPTADLAKYKFDHKESYNINDVVICHTASNNVVWVIRSPSKTDLEAMVIECSSEEEGKHLYKKFLDVSKRSKLERHRRRKSDGGSVVARSMEAIFKRDKSQEDPDRAALRYSLVQHTDRNGITHIEVEQPKMPDQKMGPSQQLVAKLRSSRSSAANKKPSEKSKFAKELESILSKELESRKVFTHTRPPGESLSLRQRAPALLLKKLDEFEEKANQMWAKAEAAAAEEQNKKVWNKPTVVIDPSKMASRTPPPRSKIDNQRKERLSRIKAELLSSHAAMPTSFTSFSSMPPQSSSAAETTAVSTNTAVVSAQPASAVTSSSSTSADNSQPNVNKQILVPTKTGKEPVKKLYPKDQAIPELMPRVNPAAMASPGPRFILALPSPMQFSTAAGPAAGHHAHFQHHQPHSLPFYPVMTPHWARFAQPPPSGDFNDTNNNMGHVWAAVPIGHQRPAAVVVSASAVSQPGSVVDVNNSRGRSRDRSKLGMIDPEQRRRAQSKSPARMQAAPPTSSHDKDISGGLTRKFREFGDAFRQKISRGKNNVNLSMMVGSSNAGNAGHDALDGGSQLLKSNLKKKDEIIDHPSASTNGNGNGGSNDNKKVHFNKFATVQMME